MSVHQVALEISQFGRIDKIVEKIRELTQNYNENLRESHEAGKMSLPVEKQWTKNVY